MTSPHCLLSKYINEIHVNTLHFQIIYTNYSKQFTRVFKNTELIFSVIRTMLSNQLLLATRVGQLAVIDPREEPLAARRTVRRYRQLSDRIHSRRLLLFLLDLRHFLTS